MFTNDDADRCERETTKATPLDEVTNGTQAQSNTNSTTHLLFGEHTRIRIHCLKTITLCFCFWRFTRWHIIPRGAAFFRVYGQPHERLCSLPVSVLFRVGSAEKPTKRSETGIEPGSRDPESNALDNSAAAALLTTRFGCVFENFHL